MNTSMGSNEEEEEIVVNLKVIRTVAVKVRSSAKVKDLKSSFNNQAGVPENLQVIFYNGKHLKDEENLTDHGILSNSTLNLYLRGDSLKLFVFMPVDDKTIDHRVIVLEPTLRDTIENIKYLIQAKEGIKNDSYALFYDGKQLEEKMTLASLDMPKESVFYLVFTPRDSLSVWVEFPSKKLLKLEVKYMHRVLDLKAMIWSSGHLLVRGEGDLWYAGKRLDDDLKTLASYDIKPDSTLQVLSCTFQIFVRKWDGKTLALSVKSKDTVLDVKNLILSKVGLPVRAYCLHFCGKLLRDDQSLASYDIQKQSTLCIRYGNSTIFNQEMKTPEKL